MCRGFRRIPEEKEPEGCIGYKHEAFLRDAPELIKTIKKEFYVKKEKDSDAGGSERPKKKAKTRKTASLGVSPDDTQDKSNGVRRSNGLGESRQSSSSLRDMVSSSGDALAVANLSVGAYPALIGNEWGQLAALRQNSLPLWVQSRLEQQQTSRLFAPETRGIPASIGRQGTNISNQDHLRLLPLEREVDLLRQQRLLRQGDLGFPLGGAFSALPYGYSGPLPLAGGGFHLDRANFAGNILGDPIVNPPNTSQLLAASRLYGQQLIDVLRNSQSSWSRKR